MTRFNYTAEKEEQIFRERFPYTSNAEMAEILGCSKGRIICLAKKFGLRKTREYRREKAQESLMLVLTPEQEEYIKQNYANTKNRIMAETLHCSCKTINRFGAKFNLKKSKEFLSECGRESARITHLRGYPPKGYIVPRSQEFRFRKGETPLSRLGEEKEQERIKKAIEASRATRRKEKARIAFGLPQQTKLRIMKHSKKRMGQRWYLLHRGYEIDDEERIAYYDSNTKRSYRIEKTSKFYRFANLDNHE